jgi:hypothetical protein
MISWYICWQGWLPSVTLRFICGCLLGLLVDWGWTKAVWFCSGILDQIFDEVNAKGSHILHNLEHQWTDNLCPLVCEIKFPLVRWSDQGEMLHGVACASLRLQISVFMYYCLAFDHPQWAACIRLLMWKCMHLIAFECLPCKSYRSICRIEQIISKQFSVF